MNIRLELNDITKGAVRYAEADAAGNPLVGDDGTVCTVYFRKATFGKISATWASTGEPPKTLNLTVEEAK
jgi:hypothetical protein